MDYNILKINGFDIEAGINFCGSEKGYIATIQRFYTRYTSRIGIFDELLASGNIAELVNNVHSLKSNSRMIGANDLAQTALFVEGLGRMDDVDAVTEHMPELVEQLKIVLNLLKPIGELEKIIVNGEIDEEKATHIGRQLIAALDDYRGDEALVLMDEYLQYPFRITVKRRLQAARTNITEYLFDEALEIVEDSIKEIGE